MVAERERQDVIRYYGCSLAKISMVAEPLDQWHCFLCRCSLAKISMVAELLQKAFRGGDSCSLAKISMVAELVL